MNPDDIITEKNKLQKRLNEIYSKLDHGFFNISQLARERFLSALTRIIPYAGELNFNQGNAEIERLILEMTDALSSIMIQNDERAAEAVLKAIIESIDYTRRTDILMSEKLEGEKIARQYKVLDRLNLYVKLQDNHTTICRQIMELEQGKADVDEKQKEAERKATEIKDSDPFLAKEIQYFRDHGYGENEIGTTFLSYIGQVNDIIRSRNLMQKYAIVLERQREVKVRIEDLIYNLNMVTFGTPELLGNVQLERLQSIAEDFQKDMIKTQEQKKRLNSITDSINSTIDEMGKEDEDEKWKRVEEAQKLLGDT